MRSTPVGIVMLNDERDHVWKANDAQNRAVVEASGVPKRWRKRL